MGFISSDITVVGTDILNSLSVGSAWLPWSQIGKLIVGRQCGTDGLYHPRDYTVHAASGTATGHAYSTEACTFE